MSPLPFSKLYDVTGYSTFFFWKKNEENKGKEHLLIRSKLKTKLKTPTSKSALKISVYLLKKICLDEFSLIYFVDHA